MGALVEFSRSYVFQLVQKMPRLTAIQGVHRCLCVIVIEPIGGVVQLDYIQGLRRCT
jgi:hypothetical protein